MIYKDYKGIKISALGMGMMRLPVVDGNEGRIDEKKLADMVAYAMEHGINYYDTAWAIWIRLKRSLKSRSSGAAWIILTSIFCTISAR